MHDTLRIDGLYIDDTLMTHREHIENTLRIPNMTLLYQNRIDGSNLHSGKVSLHLGKVSLHSGKASLRLAQALASLAALTLTSLAVLALFLTVNLQASTHTAESTHITHTAESPQMMTSTHTAESPQMTASTSTTSQTSHPTTETTTQTQSTDLPIDISAIGRGEQTDITLSLRFFDLDLFSENSQRVNQAMAWYRYLNWASLGANLFETFETTREQNPDQQTAYMASNLELFAQPTTFRTLGQNQTAPEDEIPVLIVVLVLFVFAGLGFVLARVFVSRKGDNPNVHNNNN